MSFSGTSNSTRNTGLDVIRFAAVSLVLGSHLRIPESAPAWIRAWNRGGWLGVELFFVLSGFLVSSILFREHQKTGSIRIVRFLLRRGLKIYPAFWLMMGATLGVYMLSNSKLPEPHQVWGEVLFVQNYLGGIWPHTWSLAVEEHFYLGLAALLWFLLSRSGDRGFDTIPWIFLLVTIACHFFRAMDPYWLPQSINATRGFWTHHCIDGLFFGVLIAYLVRYRDLEVRLEWIPTWLLISLGALFLSHAFSWNFPSWLIHSSSFLSYFGSGLILFAALRHPTTSLRPVRWMAALGVASYSTYLWHIPVNVWGYWLIERFVGTPNYWVYLFLYVTASFGFGYVMNRLFENRFLAWRDHFFPEAERLYGKTDISNDFHPTPELTQSSSH